MDNSEVRIRCPVCDGLGHLVIPDPPSLGRPKIADYLATVARQHGIKQWRLVGGQRSRELVRARDIVAYLAYSKGYSNAQIGHTLGRRDASTITASRHRGSLALATDRCFREDVRAAEVAVMTMKGS